MGLRCTTNKAISHLVAAEQEREPVLLPGLHQGPPQGAQGPPKDQGLQVGLWNLDALANF